MKSNFSYLMSFCLVLLFSCRKEKLAEPETAPDHELRSGVYERSSELSGYMYAATTDLNYASKVNNWWNMHLFAAFSDPPRKLSSTFNTNFQDVTEKRNLANLYVGEVTFSDYPLAKVKEQNAFYYRSIFSHTPSAGPPDLTVWRIGGQEAYTGTDIEVSQPFPKITADTSVKVYVDRATGISFSPGNLVTNCDEVYLVTPDDLLRKTVSGDGKIVFTAPELREIYGSAFWFVNLKLQGFKYYHVTVNGKVYQLIFAASAKIPAINKS